MGNAHLTLIVWGNITVNEEQQQIIEKTDSENEEQKLTAVKEGSYAQKTDRIRSWVQLIKSVTPIVWAIVILVVLIPLLGQFFISQAFSTATDVPEKTEVVVVEKPDWSQVDRAMVEALSEARASAENYASGELDLWVEELIDRVDDRFLDWYFGYFNQKQLEFKSFFVQLSAGAVRLLNPDNPTPEEKVAEVITSDFQQELARRVLRPTIAQLRLERLTQATVKHYLDVLSARIEQVQGSYKIPQADWDRYLNEIAITINDTQGNASNLSLKLLAAGGGYLALKPLVIPIAAKIGSKVVAKLSGKAGAKIASKTGATLAGKIGSQLLDPIVGIGIIIWDVWDYYNTVKVERPILHDNIADYLQEVKYSLLYNSENGIMKAIGEIEKNILPSISAGAR